TRGRKLKEDRSQPIAEDGDALGEDPCQADAVETFGRIGETSVGLHAEAKGRRSVQRPMQQRGFRRRAVEAAVQLEAVELLRVLGEHLRPWERRRVEVAFPG